MSKCENCRYFQLRGSSNKGKPRGVCRVDPPKLHPVNAVSMWPLVDGSDWCGQFSPVVAVDDEAPVAAVKRIKARQEPPDPTPEPPTDGKTSDATTDVSVLVEFGAPANTIETIREGGITTVEAVREVGLDGIKKLSGVGPIRAKAVVDAEAKMSAG